MSEEIQENNEITQLKKKRNDFKKAISHFYGEITRLKKKEERKYKFPITLQTCLDTISQCYEYMNVLETLFQLDPENEFEDYDIEIQTASMFLTDIEKYSHELEPTQKESVEFLDKNNAVPVFSPSPHETKGKNKKNTAKAASKKQEEPLNEALIPDQLKQSQGNIHEVVNSQDVLKDELYQIAEILKEPEPIQEKPVIENKESDKIDAIVERTDTETDKAAPIEKVEIPTHDDNDNLSILQPTEDDEINLQVVVDKTSESNANIDDEIEYTDNYPIITEDTNVDEDADKEIDDIQLINNEDDNKENEDVIELTDDLKEFNIKTITRNKTNSFKAKLQKKTIDEKLVSAIKLFPYDENDENIRKEYLLSRNNMIASPHMSKTLLLMSGYYVEIASYGSWNTMTLERVMRNDKYDFVDKELIILNSIYDHIRYFSYTKNRPTFEEWLTTVKYPDYEMLFFGLFDANYPGINYFRVGCPYCGKEDIVVGKENKDLVVAIDNKYSEDALVEQITAKDINKLDTGSYLPKWANTTRVRKMANNTKILFIYEVPTLSDYIRTLTTVRRISQRDNQPIDLSKILEPGSEEYLRLLLYLYVKTIGLPIPIYEDPSRPKEPTSYKYIGLTNKADIIESINSLDFEDYISLLNGDPIRDLILKRSVYYFIKDSKCTNNECGKTIKYINLDPRKIFFSRITEAVRAILL
jgi:hypothetical protein